MIVITSTAPGGGTAQAVRTVVSDIVSGALLFDRADPAGDDSGPGNYAYPTAADFHAGAQLVDVYVHDPSSAATSTAPSYPARNYTLAPADAWSRLIEVQGFGQRFIDSAGITVGTANIRANAISRYITLSVDKTALGGTPASGWAFTVTLTGQDGFSPDQARSFSALPGGYSFGVCASASSAPMCTFNPNSVPKVMDLLTPSGVTKADELNYLVHNPVVLSGVSIP